MLILIGCLTVLVLGYEFKHKFQPDPLADLMDRIYLTPNIVTLSRPIWVVIIIILDYFQVGHILKNFLNWFALYKDHLDGVLARYQSRKYPNQSTNKFGWQIGISESGKLWDPTADKFHTISLIIIMLPRFDNWAIFWVVSLIVIDLCLLTIAWTKYYLSKNGNKYIAAKNTGANRGGKAKMVIMSTGLSFCLFFTVGTWMFKAGEIMLIVATFFAMVSLMGHLTAFSRVSKASS